MALGAGARGARDQELRLTSLLSITCVPSEGLRVSTRQAPHPAAHLIYVTCPKDVAWVDSGSQTWSVATAEAVS